MIAHRNGLSSLAVEACRRMGGRQARARTALMDVATPATAGAEEARKEEKEEEGEEGEEAGKDEEGKGKGKGEEEEAARSCRIQL